MKILPKVWKADLPPKVKFECFIHLTSNIVFPFIILVALLNVPLVIIKNTVAGVDVYYSLMSVFVLASVSTFLFYTFSQKAIHWDWQRRLMLFPVFLAGSMGFAVTNTKAVFEGLIGKKSEFARTPKQGDILKEKAKDIKYRQRKISPVVFFELGLALYFVFGISISIFYLEIAAIPFQLMFLIGFGTIGIMSLKHALTR